jgi:hypothetical protein
LGGWWRNWIGLEESGWKVQLSVEPWRWDRIGKEMVDHGLVGWRKHGGGVFFPAESFYIITSTTSRIASSFISLLACLVFWFCFALLCFGSLVLVFFLPPPLPLSISLAQHIHTSLIHARFLAVLASSLNQSTWPRGLHHHHHLQLSTFVSVNA